jgi:hypothetical protein
MESNQDNQLLRVFELASRLKGLSEAEIAAELQ